MPSETPRIVAGLLRDGNRVLLCHRSPTRRWYPDVWDLPGGHIEPGEIPGAALARELHEELGITVQEPTGIPLHEFLLPTAHMRIWLIDTWTGVPTNTQPDEHDEIAWFTADDLPTAQLAHPSYEAMLTRALTRRVDSPR